MLPGNRSAVLRAGRDEAHPSSLLPVRVRSNTALHKSGREHTPLPMRNAPNKYKQKLTLPTKFSQVANVSLSQTNLYGGDQKSCISDKRKTQAHFFLTLYYPISLLVCSFSPHYPSWVLRSSSSTLRGLTTTPPPPGTVSPRTPSGTASWWRSPTRP